MKPAPRKPGWPMIERELSEWVEDQDDFESESEMRKRIAMLTPLAVLLLREVATEMEWGGVA